MKKPNLFLVGAPKCGTTSMHYYLSQHPEIFMSDPKEIHFFCTDFHRESDLYGNGIVAHKCRTDKQYSKIFSNVKNESIIGESSVGYLYSKEAAKNIYNYNKNAKIIIMLREPIDFLYSAHSQMLYTGAETEKKFTNALKLEKKRKKLLKIKHTPYPSTLYYSELIKFSIQIERYLKYFDSKNIKIILFDDLKNNLEGEFKNIVSFLNIKNKNFIADFKIQNPNKKILFPKIKKIIKNPFIWKIPKIILPTNVYNNIRDHLLLLFISYKKRNKLDKNIKIELMKKNKIEVIKLNKLLQENNLINKEKDLIKLWGYDRI